MYNKTITVVIPVYNSQNSIQTLVDEILLFLKDYKFEIILVNDGSKDESFKRCKDLSSKNKFIKFINLTKNFGQHNATMAGLKYASGDIIITIDDDLQFETKDILKMVDFIETGYDVVFGIRKIKKQSFLRNLGSKIHTIMANAMLDKNPNIETSSFRAMRKHIVTEIVHYSGPFPYLPGLIFRTTNNIGCLEVTHKERQYGKSNYNLWRLIRVWMNGFTGFSIKPLRLATILGSIVALIGIVFGICIIVRKVINPTVQVGWTSLMAALVLFSGIQLLSIGLIGEYLGRMFLSQNQMPQYVIRESINLELNQEVYNVE